MSAFKKNNTNKDSPLVLEKEKDKEKEEERNENVNSNGEGGGGNVSTSMNLTDKERSDRKANESLGSRLENPLYVSLLFFYFFLSISADLFFSRVYFHSLSTSLTPTLYRI